jgi:hypothetical protein
MLIEAEFGVAKTQAPPPSVSAGFAGYTITRWYMYIDAKLSQTLIYIIYTS